VARAIRQSCQVDARIKWPNDVIVNGKKLAGVLVETGRSRMETMSLPRGAPAPRNDYLVLGIGIDVNCSAEDLPQKMAGKATSLQIETGHPHDRIALAARVLATLDECYPVAVANFETIADEWAHLCTTLGQQIVVTMGRRRIEGFAQALDGDGALLLRRDNGHIERIVSGDLAVERA
jgi:BirA family biotin operon repressor/biotin-[acetyl-CoA-carboxylase] ligase